MFKPISGQTDWSRTYNQSYPEDSERSSDEDYSPGSLVIDIGEGNGSPRVTPASIPTQPFILTHDPPPLALEPPSVSVAVASVEGVKKVTFVGRANVSPQESICLYIYHWGEIPLDVISRHEDSLIPVRNIYEKAIVGLNRKVLSARTSRLGIRSLVLTEPYVSALKHLGLKVTRSSHFVTIMDFMSICKYFKTPPPESVIKFCSVTSQIEESKVLQNFDSLRESQGQKRIPNSQAPPSAASTPVVECSSQSNSSVAASVNSHRSSPSLQQRKHPAYSTPPTYSGFLQGQSGSLSSGIEGVDIRQAPLPNGSSVFILVREGVAFLPNTEVTKILPIVGRTGMESIRYMYGITVHHATKPEIIGMKTLGVIGLKAGRSLVYRVADVAKMFEHWRSHVPEYIAELCMGKLPPRIDTKPMEPPHIQTRLPYPTQTPTTSHSHEESPVKMELNRDHHFQQLSASTPHPPPSSSPFTPPAAATHPRSEGAVPPYSFPARNPDPQQFLLTPEQFQQPVQIMRNIQQGLVASPSAPLPPSYSQASGRMASGVLRPEPGGSLPSAPNFMSPSGTRLDIGQPRRRMSSSSGVALDDKDLEYSHLQWGEQTFTLLCPPRDEPYVAIPEIVSKVFHYRSFVSSQRRKRLDVVTLPATSLQIHALRARGSLDSFTGNTKLITLSSAVKLAVDGNFQVPSGVLERCSKYLKDSVELQVPNWSTSMGASAPPGATSALPGAIPSSSNHQIPLPTYSYPGVPSSMAPCPPTSSPAVASPKEVPSTFDKPRSREWLAKLVPHHPDVLQLGPDSILTDGVMCQVRWGNDKMAVYISKKQVCYMGLYQVYEILFKKYVNRMNFKMRMRKLDIRSIRSPSLIRVKLIELNALPQSSPVCGLIKVYEMERIAQSYGIIPPNVFYDVFMQQGTQKQISESDQLLSKRQPGRKALGKLRGPRKNASHPLPPPYSSPFASVETLHSVLSRPLTSAPSSVFHSQFAPPLWNQTSFAQQLQHLSSPQNLLLPAEATRVSTAGEDEGAQLSTTGAGEEDALVISIPRTLTQFPLPPLAPMPTVPPAQMITVTMQDTHPNPTYLKNNLVFQGSVLQNLAKKISQKTKKLGAASTNRKCPSCHKINTAMKKRCQFCGEFLIGRPCPKCGTLNHNRTKDCFRCNCPIVSPWERNATQNSVMPYGQPHHSISSSYPLHCSAGNSVLYASSHGNRPTYIPHSLSIASSQEVRDGGKDRGEQGGEEGGELRSPSSPQFAAPPIRSAVLKNMFPQIGQDPEKQEIDTQVVTKTMFSGNLTNSRKCQECGQLNSRMAKKCMQCRSPLQGKPCPRCNRPNHHHSTECYKCGEKLPITANKWIYVGARGGRAYHNNESSNHLGAELDTSAPLSCVRCHKLRSHRRMKCGRCGNTFETRAMDSAEGGEEEGSAGRENGCQGSSPKKWRGSQEETGSGHDHDRSTLLEFANNILNLDIGEQLNPLIAEVERLCGEEVDDAENNYEALEESYQNFQEKKEAKDEMFRDAQAELSGLIRIVEDHNNKLRKVLEREREAEDVIQTYPSCITSLQAKVLSAKELFIPSS